MHLQIKEINLRLLLLILVYNHQHRRSLAERICTHVHPRHHEVSHARLEPHHVLKKRSPDQPLRILLLYDESMYRLDSDKFKLINDTILPQAVQFWERALFVRRAENTPIRLTRKCNESQVFIKDGTTHCIDSCKEQTMCGEVRVPDEHLDVCRVCNSTGQNCRVAAGSVAGPGITGTDFVFYVSAVQTERCNKSQTVAFAAHCQQEAGMDRPIAGHANLCPDTISTKRQDLESLLSTVKHELLHALGFSISLYAFYRDRRGDPLTPRRPETNKPPLNEVLQTYQWSDRVIKTITRKNWMIVKSKMLDRVVNLIVTPTVVREVRSHFQCDDLEGAELEDQGGEGTSITHWEKRVFENEAMTGVHTQNPVISRITLALMEDTGWYRANYSIAEPLTWGKNLGCNFVKKSCKVWMTLKAVKGLSIHPFCNKVKRDPLQTECTNDRSSVALCNIMRYNYTLPKLYQNFDSLQYVEPGDEDHFGGSISLTDYCPYVQEFTWRMHDVIIRGSHCQFTENNPAPEKNFALERYGTNSRCFEHSDQMWGERTCRQSREWQHWGSGCYEYSCEHGRLHIKVGNYTYKCYHPNQNIMISILYKGWLHEGSIVCPPCRELCAEELALKGERCKVREESPPSSTYSRDELPCGAGSSRVDLVVGAVFVFSILKSIR